MSKDTFDSVNVRVERLIYLPGVTFCDSLPEDFKGGFCFDLPDEQELFAQLPELRAVVEDEGEPEDVAYALMGRKGFLVQAATPCKTFHKDGKGYSYSWGNYWTAWLYAETPAQIQAVAVKWAKAREAEDRADKAAA